LGIKGNKAGIGEIRKGRKKKRRRLGAKLRREKLILSIGKGGTDKKRETETYDTSSILMNDKRIKKRGKIVNSFRKKNER